MASEPGEKPQRVYSNYETIASAGAGWAFDGSSERRARQVPTRSRLVSPISPVAKPAQMGSSLCPHVPSRAQSGHTSHCDNGPWLVVVPLASNLWLSGPKYSGLVSAIPAAVDDHSASAAEIALIHALRLRHLSAPQRHSDTRTVSQSSTPMATLRVSRSRVSQSTLEPELGIAAAQPKRCKRPSAGREPTLLPIPKFPTRC